MKKSLKFTRLRQTLLTTISGTSVAGLLLLTSGSSARALNLYDGSNGGNNLEINLMTTVSYTGTHRVNSPSAILAGPTNANGNDGDANFRSGIVGNLFEAVPVLDIKSFTSATRNVEGLNALADRGYVSLNLQHTF
jgi:hypothetical protein